MDKLSQEKLDCVVVGAGWNGLAAAKQFYSMNPNSIIAIFDSQSSLGGKWAESRIFQGLKSNNLLGMYEFPDFPMSSDKFNIKPGQHIPGEVIHAYLKAYAKNFDIERFIRLETLVLTAEHQDGGGWVLTVQPMDQEPTTIFASQLIIATGLLSEPLMPRFDGQETFGGKVFHSKDFPQHSDTLKAKSVTVYGAGKSGWDAVYEYAKAGVKVYWVIRSSGHGPCWMSPPYATPFKIWIEQLANTRFLTWFSPCIWGDADGYQAIRKFYHGTALGRALVDGFWKILGQDILTGNNFDAHPDTAKLKPWVDPMFFGCSYSFLNYKQDIFEFVKSSLVGVYIDEIARLSPGSMHPFVSESVRPCFILALDLQHPDNPLLLIADSKLGIGVHLVDGTEFASDVFFANTGWRHVTPMKFLPEGIERELGIPHGAIEGDNVPPEDLANQHTLVQQADEEILRRFPRLKNQPVWNKSFVPASSDTHLTPWMLYRFLVPPSPRFLRTRDIAFIGLQTNFSNSITAHISGLWISAFFSGKLARDPGKLVDNDEALKQVQYETMLHNRFGRWRYPTEWGNKGPNFIFDAVPYLDLLQHDLGLRPFRKGGMLAEMYSPYGPKDYRGINEEWRAKQDGKEKEE